MERGRDMNDTQVLQDRALRFVLSQSDIRLMAEIRTRSDDLELEAEATWFKRRRRRLERSRDALEALGKRIFRWTQDARFLISDLRRELIELQARAERAERALQRAGYTYLEGAAEWRPPLGKRPNFEAEGVA